MRVTNAKDEKVITEKPIKIKLKDGSQYEVTVIHPENTDAFKTFWDAYLELCINQFEKEMLEEMDSSKTSLSGAK